MVLIILITFFAFVAWAISVVVLDSKKDAKNEVASDSKKDVKNELKYRVLAVVIGAVVGIIVLFNTASGRRLLIDAKSDLTKGLDRTVVVYTANGDEIARYEGKIDIEANDGGYVKFDFEGKRYMYYNCFIESIADID